MTIEVHGIVLAPPHIAGTSIAISRVAMRLSEAITIYLATGAPFSVRYFLHAQAAERRVLKVLKAVAAGLSWPLVVWRILVGRFAQSSSAAIADSVSKNHEEKIQGAKRRLLAAIHALSELTADASGTVHEDLERTAYVLRENVETYVGLAPAVNEAAVDGSPKEHAKELFRIAGRKGDDLLLATRCAHRRNVARIVEHYTRARILLVHAIADLREAVERMRPQIVANGIAERRLSVAAVELYKHAFDLLSLMGDDEAAMRIAELLNRELSRLRRLEIMETRTVLTQDQGEELCKAHTSRPPHAPLSSESTLAQG
jgi:hypothetical protein